MSATVIVDENYENILHTEISNILTDTSNLDFRSRSDYIEELNGENEQSALLGFVLCIVILAIGILNFANTSLTNIFTRQNELAILQSIGMTKKQCKIMLILECLYYMIFVLGILVTLGYGMSYIIINSLSSGSTAYAYHFTLMPLIICTPILLAIAILFPLDVYMNISKDSVIQRLRAIE